MQDCVNRKDKIEERTFFQHSNRAASSLSGACPGCPDSRRSTPHPSIVIWALIKELSRLHHLGPLAHWLPVGFHQWEAAAGGQKEGLERSGYHSPPWFGSCSVVWPLSVHSGNGSLPSALLVASPMLVFFNPVHTFRKSLFFKLFLLPLQMCQLFLTRTQTKIAPL